jgi:DNA-binding NarL/FixJ family response regulator
MGIKVLLADDHVVVREGLRALVNQQADMEVVGEADNGKEAVELARQLKPDVVVMDVAMPTMSGIEATRQIKAEMPDLKVVALSAHNNRAYIMGMVKAGVSGYLLKDCVFQELAGAIQTVLQDKSYLSPGAARVILDVESETQTAHGCRANSVTLSELDCELIKLLAEGKSAREIAAKDNLSVKTVEGRRRRIMKKLNVESMAELVRYALQEGMVPD